MSTEISNTSRSFLTFLNRREQWLEVNGYHVGDVKSDDKPVAITSGSTVVGNIFAPKVMVGGLLCGSIVAREAIVEQSGQVWGDLFALSMQVAAGGKVQGWLSSIDEANYEALLNNGRLPESSETFDPSEFLDQNVDSNLLTNRNSLQMSTLYQLQSEISLALAARSELEGSFERRIQEVAGEAAGQVAKLSAQLEEADRERKTLRGTLETAETSLAERETQLEKQRQELNISRQHIVQQKQSLEQLEAENGRLQNSLSALETAKAETDQALTEARSTIEKQHERLQNLQETVKNSLQHSSDLQVSLERWQELAETTERKVQDLENQLSGVQFDLEERTKLNAILREQKQQIEADWQSTLLELENLRHDSGEVADETAAAAVLRQVSEDLTLLEEKLNGMSQERAELLSWYELNLETLRQQLMTTETHLAEKTTQMETLETALETAVAEQSAAEAAHATEIATLTKEQERLRSQLSTAEADISYHQDELDKQGQHLAEIQARLAEREVALNEAKLLIQKQQQTLRDFRQKAEAHIVALQQKLKVINGS